MTAWLHSVWDADLQQARAQGSPTVPSICRRAELPTPPTTSTDNSQVFRLAPACPHCEQEINP